MTELKRILYVEDDLAILDLLGIALEAVGGLDARGFSSGAEAVASAAEFKPQLLLLDVMMPEMDGPMTLAALREVEGLDEVPAVFLTAKFNRSEMERLRALGAEEVLAKPFDPMTLSDNLRDIYGRV